MKQHIHWEHDVVDLPRVTKLILGGSRRRTELLQSGEVSLNTRNVLEVFEFTENTPEPGYLSVSSPISPALGLLRVILHTLGEVPDQREKCKYEISLQPPTLTPNTMHFPRKTLLECAEKPKCGHVPQHCHYQLCHFEVSHGPDYHLQ